MKKEKQYNDLIHGSIGPVMARFALPLILSSLLQMAYMSVDVYFMGHFASSTAMAGAFQGMGIIGTITYFFYGLTSGGTILLGQEYGADHKKGAAKALGNLCVLSLISVIAAMMVVLFLGRTIINWMNVPEEAVGEAWNYLYICMFGLIFVMGYNLLGSVLRCLGDSKAPFLFIVASTALNIIFDYITVGIWKMSAAGAALATITAQGICFILCIIYTAKKGLPFPFSIRDCIPDKECLKTILKLGVPVALQAAFSNFTMMIANAMINRLGVYAVAAISVVSTITSFSLMIPMSMGSAISAMTAQNIGAGETKRAQKILRYGFLFSLGCALIAFTAINLWPEAIGGILNKDPLVLVESVRYLKPVSFSCIIACISLCYSGFFNGCGATVFTMLQEALCSLLVRIPATWAIMHFVPNVNIMHAGFAAPLTLLVQGIACMVYYRIRFAGDKINDIELVGKNIS